MSVTVSLPAELGIRVQEAAAQQDWKLEDYVITAVERALERFSLDEILAPVRKQFAETGMTEEELTALVKEERKAMWKEKHAREME
jgi:hypothetical protein